jgi:hypothetical protein
MFDLNAALNEEAVKHKASEMAVFDIEGYEKDFQEELNSYLELESLFNQLDHYQYVSVELEKMAAKDWNSDSIMEVRLMAGRMNSLLSWDPEMQVTMEEKDLKTRAKEKASGALNKVQGIIKSIVEKVVGYISDLFNFNKRKYARARNVIAAMKTTNFESATVTFSGKATQLTNADEGGTSRIRVDRIADFLKTSSEVRYDEIHDAAKTVWLSTQMGGSFAGLITLVEKQMSPYVFKSENVTVIGIEEKLGRRLALTLTDGKLSVDSIVPGKAKGKDLKSSSEVNKKDMETMAVAAMNIYKTLADLRNDNIAEDINASIKNLKSRNTVGEDTGSTIQDLRNYARLFTRLTRYQGNIADAAMVMAIQFVKSGGLIEDERSNKDEKVEDKKAEE